jgi:hypothetical protein
LESDNAFVSIIFADLDSAWIFFNFCRLGQSQLLLLLPFGIIAFGDPML